MSPAWTIVTEQAFNVANDRHCCRLPRFTHDCASTILWSVVAFLFLSRLRRPSTITNNSFSRSSVFSLPTVALAHRIVSSLAPRRTVAFSFQHGLWFYRVASATTSPLYRRISVVHATMWCEVRFTSYAGSNVHTDATS